jgi:hypothetical protein
MEGVGGGLGIEAAFHRGEVAVRGACGRYVLHGEGLDRSEGLTRNSVTTLRDIQLAIAKEELMRTENGDEVERDHSAGTFISMGLEIEEAQCVFACGLCCRTLLTFTFL